VNTEPKDEEEKEDNEVKEKEKIEKKINESGKKE